MAFLAQTADPRGRQGRRHSIEAMLASVVCAVLQGARGYTAIAEWLHDQEAELWHALGFYRRPPKKGAFRKLLMAISPESFESSVRAWIQHCLPHDSAALDLEPVALDGKALCGTLRGHARMVHLLSLFDQQYGCTLSQNRVDAKTNEAKAALELLRGLVLKGRVITADAMFCQREVCQQIREAEGHYLVVVKDNQPTLREALAAEFQAAFSPDNRTTSPSAVANRRNAHQGTWANCPTPTGS